MLIDLQLTEKLKKRMWDKTNRNIQFNQRVRPMAQWDDDDAV